MQCTLGLKTHFWPLAWVLHLLLSVMGTKVHVHTINFLLPAAGSNGLAPYHHRWNEALLQHWGQDRSVGYVVPRGWAVGFLSQPDSGRGHHRTIWCLPPQPAQGKIRTGLSASVQMHHNVQGRRESRPFVLSALKAALPAQGKGQDSQERKSVSSCCTSLPDALHQAMALCPPHNDPHSGG